MCVKLDTAVQEILLSLPEFRDSRCSESQRLLKGINDMLPFCTVSSDVYEIRYERCSQKCIDCSGFCENRFIESYNLLKGASECFVLTAHGFYPI
jgi:hypothetical protein